MTTNRMLLSALAGGVTLFLLGFLVYGLALASFFDANSGSATGVSKEQMDMWALALGNLATGLLVAYIFSRWAGITTFVGGAKAGAVIFFLMTLGFDMIMYGTSNLMNLTAAIADILVYTLLGAIVGGVVGMVLGMGKKESA